MRPEGVAPSIPKPAGVLKESMCAVGEAVLPFWLRLCTMGVELRVLLPWEEVVGWLMGVLAAGCRVVLGEGTLRGGEEWARCEGVDTPPVALLEAEEGVGVAIEARSESESVCDVVLRRRP